jgi:hypothetical protein
MSFLLLHLPYSIPHHRLGGPIMESAQGPRSWPGYFLRSWTDLNAAQVRVVSWERADRGRQFVAQVFPWFLARYDAYPQEQSRRDALRYLFMLAFGGVYAEATMECLRTDALRNLRDANAGAEVVLGTLADRSVPHDFIMSLVPRSSFWLYVLECLAYEDLPHTDGRCLQRALQLAATRPWADLQVAQHFLDRGGATGVAAEQWDALVPGHGLSPTLQKFWGLAASVPGMAPRVNLLPPKAVYPLRWNDASHARYRLNPEQDAIYGPMREASSDALLQQQAQQVRAAFPYSYACNFW